MIYGSHNIQIPSVRVRSRLDWVYIHPFCPIFIYLLVYLLRHKTVTIHHDKLYFLFTPQD